MANQKHTISNKPWQDRGWYHETPWHSRGYLPHHSTPKTTQSITFRLGDSLPQSTLENLLRACSKMPEGEREHFYYQKIEKWIDSGYGSCALKNRAIAEIVRESLYYFDGKRYTLEAWVIMPNHIHLLLSVYPDFLLSDIVASIKKFTARKANELLGQKGRFWSRDYFDRFIRSQKHFYVVKAYIENNPVKAGLCNNVGEWEFSSAYGKRRR